MSKQDEILVFIRDHIEENGWAPSYREICEAVGIGSTSTVKAYIDTLEFRRLIRFGHGPRKIAMTERGLARIESLEGSHGDIRDPVAHGARDDVPSVE